LTEQKNPDREGDNAALIFSSFFDQAKKDISSSSEGAANLFIRVCAVHIMVISYVYNLFFNGHMV